MAGITVQGGGNVEVVDPQTIHVKSTGHLQGIVKLVFPNVAASGGPHPPRYIVVEPWPQASLEGLDWSGGEGLVVAEQKEFRDNKLHLTLTPTSRDHLRQGGILNLIDLYR